MKKYLSILSVGLLTLSITACSSFRGAVYNNDTSNQGTTNITAKPLALAIKAYELLDGDKDSKMLVTDDLERAYSASGATPAVIKRLLKKHDKPQTSDEKDSELETLARSVLDEKKPDFKKALRFAKEIKKPATKSQVLLRIAKDMPKDKRLAVLRDADKAIAKTKLTKLVYEKRSKLLKLAKMYFESGDKQSARKTILSSHALLIRNTSSSNAIDFGTVAELESQLGIQPSILCKLTRFLHKTKDRPIALVKITAAYINYGYQGQVCMPDKELIAAIRNMPDAASRASEPLVLAEAWYNRKEKNKSSQLYDDAIQSAKLVSPPHYKFDMQSKILISLKKIDNKKLYNSFSKKYWKEVNKQSAYEQSSTLMQLALEAYDIEGLTDLSLDALSKMKDHSLKVTAAVTQARIAQKKGDQAVAKQALSEAFLAAKTTPYPVPKMDWLREVIDTAHELDNKEVAEQALKVASESVTKVPNLDLKVMYAMLLTKQAWEHKDYSLSQELLKLNQKWYEQWIKEPVKTEKGTGNKIDYYAENKRNALIDLVKSNVLLGNNAKAIALLDRLPNKNLQAKALVYAAITLAEKRKKQGVMKTDKFMLNALERKINSIRKSPDTT